MRVSAERRGGKGERSCPSAKIHKRGALIQAQRPQQSQVLCRIHACLAWVARDVGRIEMLRPGVRQLVEVPAGQRRTSISHPTQRKYRTCNRSRSVLR
jgi:hypothetical protein